MNRDRLLRHIGFWIAYLAFKTYHEFVWTYPAYDDLSWWVILRISVVAQFLMLPPKMAFTYWVLNRLRIVGSRSKRSGWLWLQLLTGLIVTLFLYRFQIVYVVLPVAYAEIPETQVLISLGSASSAIVDILLVAGVATTLFLYRKQRQSRERTEKMEREKLASELRFLRQQTNPHFLFNTLNNLYGLARRNDPRTSESILRLSKLLRFMLYETQDARIPLYKEIKWMEDYLALERLRYGDRLTITTQIDHIPTDRMIAPLLLVPLLENAFKHGASESQDEPFVDLKVSLEDNTLAVCIRNSTEHKKQAADGIGLRNLKRQLAVLYPSHLLDICPGDGIFSVSVTLNLAEYEPVLLSDSGG